MKGYLHVFGRKLYDGGKAFEACMKTLLIPFQIKFFAYKVPVKSEYLGTLDLGIPRST